MHRQGRLGRLLAPGLATAALLVGCATGGSTVQSGDGAGSIAPLSQKVLIVANFGEPPQLAVKPLVTTGGAFGIPPRFFNATFDIVDVREITHPHLVETLPQLGSDTWQIFPDGRMETRYRLKPKSDLARWRSQCCRRLRRPVAEARATAVTAILDDERAMMIKRELPGEDRPWWRFW